MDLHFKEYGPDNAKTIIILHGLFGASDNWMSVAKILSSKFHILTPDLRNHGDSPHSDEWTYHSMAADLQQLIEKEAIESPHLMGHSMGGKVAMQLLVDNSSLISKAVIVDIAPKYYPVHHRDILDGLIAIDLAGLESRGEADAEMSNYVDDPFVRQFLLKSLKRDRNGFSWKINLPVINQEIENVGLEISSSNPISNPVLFIKGENSDYITNDDAEMIKKLFPNSKLATISDAGHWVHAENPEDLISRVLEFFDNP